MTYQSYFFLGFVGLLFACTSNGQEITGQQDIHFGKLTVPENRSDPESRDIELSYAVLKAVNQKKGQLPIVFLQGGPGGPSLPMIPFWRQSPLRQDRDIILFDQRGTGRSEAHCPTVGV